MTYGIFLLLGTNLGDKLQNLQIAKQHIKGICSIEDSSEIYETAAWGKTEQPSFYNQVIKINTELKAPVLIKELLRIETQMGRIRKEKWGERLIDIDILYYHDQIVDLPELSIPHPGIPDRKFTLVPLVELAPTFINPVTKHTNQEMLDKLKDQSSVKKLALNS